MNSRRFGIVWDTMNGNKIWIGLLMVGCIFQKTTSQEKMGSYLFGTRKAFASWKFEIVRVESCLKPANKKCLRQEFRENLGYLNIGLVLLLSSCLSVKKTILFNILMHCIVFILGFSFHFLRYPVPQLKFASKKPFQ